jgi:hypothetical protein
VGLTFNHHNELHESVVRGVLATGAAAVAGLFLPAAAAAALLALALTISVVPPTSFVSLAVATLWALVAAAGEQRGGAVGEAVAALAIGGSLARGLGGWSRWVAAGCGATGALAASLVTRALDGTAALALLPNGLAALVTGATSGLIVGVASIGRHVQRTRPPVESELQALADDSELGQLLGRAATAYRDAVAAIGDEAPAARGAADELMRKMARFGKRWRELESEAARSLPEDLNERKLLVGRRLEATQDPLARLELARARDALSAQLSYLDEIRGGRERAVARLEHQVATLERLRLAALRQRSADAGRLGAELQPVVEELTQAGGDFDIAAEALTEAAGESPAVAGALPETGALPEIGARPVAAALPPRS